MTVRRLAAEALVFFLCATGALGPQAARADWVPINYTGTQFCGGDYTKDQLEYVTEPVLAVYSVTFQDQGFFTITPTTTWRTDPSQWRVDRSGFSTVPVQFTAAGDYLVFFQYTPSIWDDEYRHVTGPTTENMIFQPDGVYTGLILGLTTQDGLAVRNGSEVYFPGWSSDIDPFDGVTDSGIVTLRCVAHMRQVMPRPYVIPNLLPVFFQTDQGSWCGELTWPIDAKQPVNINIKVAPGGCQQLPTAQLAAPLLPGMVIGPQTPAPLPSPRG